MKSKQNKAVLCAFVSGSLFGAVLVLAMHIQIWRSVGERVKTEKSNCTRSRVVFSSAPC